MKLLFLTIALSIANLGHTCELDHLLPPNDLSIPVEARIGGLTETQYHQVIDKVEALYAPIAAQRGGILQILRLWGDPTVNAGTNRDGRIWKVKMFGGFARAKAMTEDGYAAVLCHEIGHHLGGAPLKITFDPKAFPWSSTESQADYFATTKCLRRVFLHDDNAAIISRMLVPETLRKSCEASWELALDQSLCIRIGMAALRQVDVFQSIRPSKQVRFETPSPKIVSVTETSYPDYQCRLDTMFQGALCIADMNEDFSPVSEIPGSCHPYFGDLVGMRPLCWYRSLD